MSDLISRQMAIDSLTEIIMNLKNVYGDMGSAVNGARECIKSLPSAGPVRTAKVISDDVIITVNGYRYHYEEYLCNACKKKVFSCDSYCSHCGEKLDWSWNE